MSYYISKNAYRMDTLFYGLGIPLFVMGIFQAILLMQPDFGSAMSLAFITISLIYMSGVRISYLLGLLVLMLPGIIALLVYAPYRMARITAFIDPWQDPLGKGYQLIQSFIALGNGGLTGLGPGGSQQKLFFLPESHTDFIFSIIGEEFGIIGASLIIVLFLWILFRGVRIAVSKEEPFAYYLAMGVTVMLTFQALINFSVTTGLMPTKGLPLPFVSYGGSSLLISMAAAGILMNIAKAELNESIEDTVMPCALTTDRVLSFSNKYQKMKQRRALPTERIPNQFE
jgi:cell division protein FtsW